MKINEISNYGFSEESKDFCGCKVFNTLANQYIDDYNISIDMAKEICMIQRNEAGKMFRRYFIEVEKQWSQVVKSPIERILANSVDQLEAVEAIKEVLLVEKQKQALIEQQRDKAEEAKAIAEQERDSVKEAFSRSVVSDNDKLYSTFIKELKMTNPWNFSVDNGDYSNSIFFDRVQMEGNRDGKYQIWQNTKIGISKYQIWQNTKIGISKYQIWQNTKIGISKYQIWQNTKIGIKRYLTRWFHCAKTKYVRQLKEGNTQYAKQTRRHQSGYGCYKIW